jgi:hypothetical protein
MGKTGERTPGPGRALTSKRRGQGGVIVEEVVRKGRDCSADTAAGQRASPQWRRLAAQAFACRMVALKWSWGTKGRSNTEAWTMG